MTAVSKFAGAIDMANLDAQIRARLDRQQNRPAADAPTETQTAAPQDAVSSMTRPDVPYAALLRFLAINLSGFALVGAAWTRGWVATVVDADRTGLTLTIVAVFLAGLGFCAFRLWRIARETHHATRADRPAKSWARVYLSTIAGRDSGARSIAASALQLRLGEWIAPVRHVANSLVLLGLIGTVIGFIIALSGVDPDKAGDFNAVAPMVSTLIEGMSTALYTTLVGAVLNVWLMVNYHLLAGGTVKLITALVDLGEEHAGT